MVSPWSISFMILTLILSVAVPVVTFVYFYKKKRIYWKPVLVGVGVFIVFSQVLEKFLNLYILEVNSLTSEWLKNPYLFALYGALAAGLFEEGGRFLGFYYLLNKYREWKDGLAYGIGHGGIEAILIGVFAGIQNTLVSLQINSGSFNHLLASGKENSSALLTIKEQLVNTPSFLFLMTGFERIFIFLLQIALSLLVLYAIKKQKIIFVFYAILIHTAINIMVLLSKSLNLGPFIPQVILLLSAIGSLLFIQRTKRRFSSVVENTEVSTS